MVLFRIITYYITVLLLPWRTVNRRRTLCGFTKSFFAAFFCNVVSFFNIKDIWYINKYKQLDHTASPLHHCRQMANNLLRDSTRYILQLSSSLKKKKGRTCCRYYLLFVNKENYIVYIIITTIQLCYTDSHILLLLLIFILYIFFVSYYIVITFACASVYLYIYIYLW